MSLVNTIEYISKHPLNRNNKVVSIVRYLKWQIGARIIPGDVIFPWINNSMIIAGIGERGVTGNVYCGLHEFNDMSFLLHALRETDIFVDVGANSGSYTILACSAVGSKGFCFEPIPSSYERLVKNIRLNGVEDRVEARNIALGELQDKIHFTSDQDCTNHALSRKEKKNNSIEVSVSTLDDELSSCPFMLKIDVEGFETSVVNGGKKTLSNPNLCVVIMEIGGSVNRYGYDQSCLVKIMRDFGFTPYKYEPFKRTLLMLNGRNENSGNTLFIRDYHEIKTRLESAKDINVLGMSY